MNRKIVLFLSLFLALMGTACTHQEAASIGTMVGRPIGYPIGMTSVALSEALGTASDIHRASPRQSMKPNKNIRHSPIPSRSTNKQSISRDTSHYYETKLVIKSKGPVDIEDVYFKDSKDVTDFWE